MNIGLCQVISISNMNVITYTFSSYELAQQQAMELLKGINYEYSFIPEIIRPNGLREFGIRIPKAGELIMIIESEVGTEILPVE